jgi:hypothetical protein
MPRKRALRKHSRSGGNRGVDTRAELLRSDIDLGFTFVAVALTSYTAGNTGQARKAAKDAHKKLRSAQKQLANVEMGRDERHTATKRLENLEQVLATIEARDPGVLASRPSAGENRPDGLFSKTPGGPRGRKSGGGSQPAADGDGY